MRELPLRAGTKKADRLLVSDSLFLGSTMLVVSRDYNPRGHSFGSRMLRRCVSDPSDAQSGALGD